MSETLYACEHCNNVVSVEQSQKLPQCPACGEGREGMNINHWRQIGIPK